MVLMSPEPRTSFDPFDSGLFDQWFIAAWKCDLDIGGKIEAKYVWALWPRRCMRSGAWMWFKPVVKHSVNRVKFTHNGVNLDHVVKPEVFYFDPKEYIIMVLKK